MKVSLIQLLHASLVARHGSFSEAARRCNASQPTVSNNVSDLEELLGKKLFLRTTRKVELSPFGRALLPSIEEALAAAHRVTAEAEALLNPEKKLLRIAYTPLLDIGRINALCAAYRQSNPDVEIVFKECAHDSLEDRLMSEQVDVACAHDIAKRREFARCKMFKDPLHYIPANGATEGATEMIPLDRVAQNTLLLTVGTCGLAPTTLKLLSEAQLDANIYAGRAMTHFGLQEWAQLGLGGAILPATRIKGDSAKFPKVAIDGNPSSLVYEVVWLKSSRATKHLNGFFTSIPNICKSTSVKSGIWSS